MNVMFPAHLDANIHNAPDTTRRQEQFVPWLYDYDYGWTPLHYAARDGRLECVRWLAEIKTPLNARTIAGHGSEWYIWRYVTASHTDMDQAAGSFWD